MTSRFLITTADERTWKFDRPVLFLGEWCKRYGRRHVWNKMDAVVADPYGLDPEQKNRDIYYTQSLANQLVQELSAALNVFHQTDYSERYWAILIGHWVHRYVSILFNRFSTIVQACDRYVISETIELDSSGFSLLTNTSGDQVNVCNDDVWNNVIYSRILRYLKNVKIEVLDNVGLAPYCSGASAGGGGKRRMKSAVKAFVQDVAMRFARENDAFIINSYLPRIEEMKLQILLGQFPQFWHSPNYEQVKPDFVARETFSLNSDGYDGFEKFVRDQIGDHIPICYLEGYKSLTDQVKQLPWPKKPKFIFTSNNYNTDELFKAWSANLVDEKKCPFFIGQHGNLYGTEIGSENYPEEVLGDRFFTWGWTNGDSHKVPTFLFKTINRKPRKKIVDGGLLLIEVHPPHLLMTWDCYYEYVQYQEEQFRFVDALPISVQNELVVRLHPAYDLHKWSAKYRWDDRCSKIAREYGVEKIEGLLKKSRLVVHSYDSTGMLETLNLNIPTVCFWRGEVENLLPSAKLIYQRLKDVGIIHSTPKSAAQHVSLFWDSLDDWWESEKVQEVRSFFCEQYARSVNHPVRMLSQILINHVGE